MKVQVYQDEHVTIFGLQISEMDKMIASSDIFLCMWSKYSPDEIQKKQIVTAIFLKKPFIIAREKGTTLPEEVRKYANIVFEYEFDRGNRDSLIIPMNDFLEHNKDKIGKIIKKLGEMKK